MWWWWWSCRSTPPINIDQEKFVSSPKFVSPTPLPHCRRGASCRAVAAAVVAAGPPSFTQRGRDRRDRRHARSGRNAQLLPGRPAYRRSSETLRRTATSSNSGPARMHGTPAFRSRRRPLLLRCPPAQGLAEEETRRPRQGPTGAPRAASRRRAGAGGAGGLCR